MPRLRTQSRAVAAAATLALAATALAATPIADAAATTSIRSNVPAKAAATAGVITQDQALRQARASHKPVTVSSAESATSALTANPNGTLTLTTYAQPVRKKVDGTWRALDANLVKHPDGTVSPALSAAALTLSGGGTGPFVTLHSGSQYLSMTSPVELPVPVLSGDTATYSNVLPGIDLRLTANIEGGFTDVYIVHSAEAAANPKLSSLLTATVHSSDLNVTVDPVSHTLRARDNSGSDIFDAPAPTEWDSASTAPVAAAAHRAATATQSAAPGTASTADAPGTRAHQGGLTPRISGSTLTLNPDTSILTDKSAVYPAYIDPPWSTYSNGNWSVPSENFPTQPYWDTSSESNKALQVGQSPSGFWADSLLNFNINTSVLYTGGAPKFQTAYFYATNIATNNHADSAMWVYAPSTTLDQSNDYWNAWFGSSRNLGSSIGTETFAQDTTQTYGIPISTSWVTSSKTLQTFALAGDSYSDEQNSTSYYKILGQPGQSAYTPPSIALTFTHAPTVSHLSTSPDKSIIGDGSVALNALASDVDGGTLNAAFTAYVDGNSSEVIKSGTVSVGANTYASMWIYQSTLDADDTKWGTSGNLKIDWSVTVSNGNSQSASASASFTFSTAIPGAPNIWADPTTPLECPGNDAFTVGTATTLYLTPEGSTAPTSYTYQLNAAQPITVPASGTTSITIVPTSPTTILSVNAIAASGNIGQAQTCIINASAAPNASPGNLAGGPNPDLVIPGAGTANLPAGLWDATATSNAQINANASNIGIYGTGSSGAATNATAYNGMRIVIGLFQGTGFNDALVYNPTLQSKNNECTAQILYNFGNDRPLDPSVGTAASGPVFTVNDGQSTAVCATDVANGGSLSDAENGASTLQTSYTSSSGVYFPDLVMIANGKLVLDPSSGTPGTYGSITSAATLATSSPTGSDWSGWRIYTSVNGTTNLPSMFAVNQSTGAVYYYSATALAQLTYNAYNTPAVTVTAPAEVATSGFSTSSYADLEATSANGNPGLWAVAVPTTGTTPASVYTFSLNSAGTALTQVNSTSGTKLDNPAHSWALNDGTSGTATSAIDADSSTTLNASGSGATWSQDDIFNPDINLDGTGNMTSSTTSMLNLTDSFTVSVWVKPETSGMMVLSQDGTNYPGLMLYPTGGSWTFYLAKDDGTATWGGDSITGGSVQLGAWTHVVATYDKTTSTMSLYVDDTFVATGKHTAPPTGASKALRLGSNIDGGKQTSYLTGEISQVQTWSGQVLPPVQPYTPASYHQSIIPERLLDTRVTGTNSNSQMKETNTPVGADSTITVPIIGDTITANGASTTSNIPASATAVAVDVTLTQETSNGNVIAYADGSQLPLTSSTNYITNTGVTGYQIVPIGPDGKIALYNSSSGTTHMIIDITGYFTSNATLTGDQTYTSLTTAQRLFDSRSNMTHTSLGTGVVPAGTTFTVNIDGVDGIASNATAVAINLTALNEANGGYLEAYPTGETPTYDTALTYSTGAVASMAADIPVGTGGTITIKNVTASANIIGDISGYYTTDETGQVYHSVNPTRLADTRAGIGGQSTAIAANGNYFLADAGQITTSANPTLALMLTAADTASNGDFIAYPTNPTNTAPGTSNVNWDASDTRANLALTSEGTSGEVTINNASPGTTDLVVDCSGYFAAS